MPREVHRSAYVELIGKRPRVAQTRLLPWQGLVHRRDWDVIRMLVVVERLVGGGVRQCNPGVVRPCEVEGGGEVAADGAAPRRDVGFDQVSTMPGEAPLEEADERGVVEELRADPAALA